MYGLLNWGLMYKGDFMKYSRYKKFVRCSVTKVGFEEYSKDAISFNTLKIIGKTTEGVLKEIKEWESTLTPNFEIILFEKDIEKTTEKDNKQKQILDLRNVETEDLIIKKIENSKEYEFQATLNYETLSIKKKNKIVDVFSYMGGC